MRPTPGLHEATPRDYVRQLNLRHAISPHVYRSILNSFYRFVSKRTKNARVSEKVVHEWLKARHRVWPFHLVAHRARLVDRYLDWAVRNGSLQENPLAKLRTEYGQRTTRPIVRALLSPQPHAALAALRPAPRFGSFLGPLMREHLTLMRAMGYRYNWCEKHMLKLDRFLQRRRDLAGQSLRTVIQEWTNAKSSPQHALDCLKLGRVLSKALLRVDPNNKVIAWDRLVERAAEQRHRRPYILSESDICRRSVRHSPGNSEPCRCFRQLVLITVLLWCPRPRRKLDDAIIS